VAKKTFQLKQAADAVGVSTITLKRWFLEGKVDDVQRNRNGWRIFDEQDIRRLLAFKNQVREQQAPYEVSGTTSHCFTVASFFSGIGGLELGFERKGFRVVFQCEIDDFCTNILAQHWPNVQRKKDIRSIADATDLPECDIWIGGFPCQDVSLARMGPRKGLGGRQSALFHEFVRLLAQARPGVFVIENVHGLLNSHKGRDFQTVVSALAELGYAIGWRTFNSQYFGVPQSRRRVYIVGCHRDRGGPGAILFEPERSEGNAKKSKQNGKKPLSPFKEVIGETDSDGPVYQRIAYCLYACSARHTGTDWSRTYVSYPKRGAVRRLTPKECEGIMGFPEGWTVPTNGDFSEDDIETKRYHALGNAVTPPVAEWLAGRIYEYLMRTKTEERDSKLS